MRLKSCSYCKYKSRMDWPQPHISPRHSTNGPSHLSVAFGQGAFLFNATQQIDHAPFLEPHSRGQDECNSSFALWSSLFSCSQILASPTQYDSTRPASLRTLVRNLSYLKTFHRSRRALWALVATRFQMSRNHSRASRCLCSPPAAE